MEGMEDREGREGRKIREGTVGREEREDTVVSLVYERPLLLSRQGTVRHTPVQYDVRTAWFNYTRRDGTTYAGMLLSRNGTKTYGT